MNIGRSLQNKTKKGKFFEISLKMNCIDFEFWHVNIHEQQLMSNAYIKNEHWTFFAKQNRKRKNSFKFI